MSGKIRQQLQEVSENLEMQNWLKKRSEKDVSSSSKTPATSTDTKGSNHTL
ncbi:MAG: hypothetical protein H3C47_03545 [Candidatus Cloacimonetes bacterium]|nr:hypothetical protein [Candidatus Cloacimonadota bacterium]